MQTCWRMNSWCPGGPPLVFFLWSEYLSMPMSSTNAHLAAFCSVYPSQHEVIWRLHSLYSESLGPSLHHEWSACSARVHKVSGKLYQVCRIHPLCCESLPQQSRPTTIQVLWDPNTFQGDLQGTCHQLLISMFHPSLKVARCPVFLRLTNLKIHADRLFTLLFC